MNLQTSNFQLQTSLSGLVLLVFVEGFVSVSVEVLTIRQLIPFVGNSVIVTSLIIGFFLLFLALGYARGGHRRGDLRDILRRNFLLAGLLTGVGLSYPFIGLLFDVMAGLGNLGALVVYLLLVTSPIAYLLGQTVPIGASLYPDTKVGRVSGHVLFLSTLGSFLGSVLSSLWLMNWLGVGGTVLVDFLLLAVLTLLLSRRPDRVMAGLAVVGLAAWWLNVDFPRRAFVAETVYGTYEVRESGGARELLVNNSRSSRIDTDGENFWYIETLRRLLFREAGLVDRDILVLGAGGFTLSLKDNTNRFTYVDIDPLIQDIVATHFNPQVREPDFRGRFVAEDARTFIQGDGPAYDAIVSDVYLNHITVPAHLLTAEHFGAIARRLKPDGVAAFNMILNPYMSDPYSRRVDDTLGAVFHHCIIVPRHYRDAVTNVIYACRKPRQNEDRMVYTDDRNRASLDVGSLGKR